MQELHTTKAGDNFYDIHITEDNEKIGRIWNNLPMGEQKWCIDIFLPGGQRLWRYFFTRQEVNQVLESMNFRLVGDLAE